MSEKTDQVVEESVELDEAAVKSIVEKTSEAVKPEIEKIAADANKAIEDGLAKIESTIKKATAEKPAEEQGDDPVAKAIKAGTVSEEMVKESKEMRFFKAARALANKDSEQLKSYNALAFATRQKAGYQNTDVEADGGALVPDAEFDTTIYENLANYGVAFANADVRQTERNAVRFITLDSGLEFYATDEAGVKTSAKLAFSKALVELQKYAVIVPSTDELSDDAAMDFWNLVTRELTRAYAKKADEITFTHATSGITNTTGVITEPVSGAGTTITWDDLLAAEGAGEDDDNGNKKWYMRKETWFRLVATRGDDGGGAGTGHYLFQPNPNQPVTPWGTPVTFTRVLPKSNEVGSNDAFAVYGDLNNYVLYTKRGMALKVLTEATIVDTESQNFNLATQDGTAMRAVVRMLGKLPKGNAGKFVVLGTGTVS